jgi:hypothetical protein
MNDLAHRLGLLAVLDCAARLFDRHAIGGMAHQVIHAPPGHVHQRVRQLQQRDA